MLSDALMFILWIILTILLITFTYSMSLFVKKQKLEVEEKEKFINSDLVIQEEAIQKLMELIDIQIDLELAHEFLPYISTSKKFDILGIDKVCDRVSNHVFESFSTSQLIKFTRYCRLYNNSFWADYIVKKTTCMAVAQYLGTQKTEE